VADVKSDAKKEFLGQPVWIWAVAGLATVAVAVYLYRRNAASQAAADAAASPDAGGAASGSSSLYGWMLDQQSSPAPAPAPSRCPPGMHPNVNGICVCASGYFWNTRTGKCQKKKAAA
jgi:hypothetical protein